MAIKNSGNWTQRDWKRQLVRLFSGRVERGRQQDFDRELAKNMQWIGRVVMPFILLFQIYNILRVIAFSDAKLATANNRRYFILYVILLLATAVGILFAYAYPRDGKRARYLVHAGFVYTAVICLWGVGITSLDLARNENVDVYMTIVITTAVFVYLRPWQAAAVYATSQLLLYPAVLSGDTPGLWINSTAMALMAMVVSVSRYATKRNEFEQRVLITQRSEEIHDINAQLQKLVMIDNLTGLFNRRFLDERLPGIWAERQTQGGKAAVIMLDIDDFKHFNDTHGHLRGDACLRVIAKALRDCCSDDDSYSVRYGGEEFAVVLLGRPEAEVLSTAEEVLGRIRLKSAAENCGCGAAVTVSAGICCGVPGEGESLQVYIQRADQALYEAKREGKDRVAFWKQ